MRRALVSLLALGVAVGLSLAPRAHGAPARAPAPRPALWRVVSTKATVHLFGSVHVGTRDIYPLDPVIRQAFRAADTLVLEIPIDSEAEARTTQLLLEAARLEPPDALSRHLDPATRAKLRAALRAIGLPAQSLEPVRPWFAAVTLMLTRAQALGYHPEDGVDRHFHRLAEKKRVDALETAEAQVGLFRDMPDEVQVDLLRQTLEELDGIEQTLAQTFEAWRRGDTEALDALLLAPMREQYPALHEALLLRRNRHMAERITAMLAGAGNTFVVVGTGHLIGPGSIVELLRKRGFEVKRI